MKFNCRDWPKGLNHEVINNDPLLYNCQFKFPDKCHIDILNKVMDYSEARNVDCFKDNPNADKVMNTWKNYLINKYNGNEMLYDFKAIIYPETNNDNFTFNKFETLEKFHDSITKNIIITNDTKLIEEKNPEIMLLKQKEKYEIKIDLKFKEELSFNRNKILNEENPDNLITANKNNILFLYIDALSRPHFFRKMKYLTKFLSKFNKNSSYEVFQFMKYQSFKNDYYASGIQTIFYESNPKINRIKPNNSHILSLLKQKGYITAQSANYCFKEFYPVERELNYFKKTNIEEYDHENIAMFCDPFFLRIGDNPCIKKCLYGKNSFEYVLDYGYQFWTKYQENKKFLRLSFFEGNEKTGEVIKYLDYYLYKFLDNLYQNDLLNNTFIFLVSGQGNSYNDLYNSINYLDYDFFIEKYLGTFFILLDKKGLNLTKDDLINIKNNQQNMVTAYDIHYTLKNIVQNKFYSDTKEVKEDNDENLGKSLFGFINSKERGCFKYKQIGIGVCRCYDF